MELKEEHVLGQTHEKLFCFDVGQLNFGYISGMVFSNISGDGGWHKSMVRAFLRAKSVWFHQVIVVCCAKMQLALQPFPSCVKTYILVQNIANRSIINTFFTVFCPTFIRERKRKEYWLWTKPQKRQNRNVFKLCFPLGPFSSFRLLRLTY